MARRMLDASIAEDDRLNSLSTESMLLFLMTIPHLDRDGLIDGRPHLLWAKVAPLQRQLEDQAPQLIQAWVDCGMVLRYPGERNNPVLWFTGFAKNQTGMRYHEQGASRFPPPPGMYRHERSGLRPLSEEQERSAQEAQRTLAGTTGLPRGNHEVSAGQYKHQYKHQDQPEVQEQDQHQHQSGGGDGVWTVVAMETLLNRLRYERESDDDERMMVSELSLDEMTAVVLALAEHVDGLGREFRGIEQWLQALSVEQMRVALRTVWQWMWDPKTQQGIRNLPAVLRSAVNKRQTGSDFDDDMLQRALPYLVNQLARVEV